MAIIYLSLGTNMGDRLQNLRRAISGLKTAATVTAVSPIYVTKPWGPIQDQPDFYNLCVAAESELEPLPLLDFIKALEVQLGRELGERWGPRLIDIDLLFYDQVVLKTARLEIPHAQIAERAFVLVPLADIAPDFEHPTLKRTIMALCAAVDESEVVKIEAEIE